MPGTFLNYLAKLQAVTRFPIGNFEDYLTALYDRHNYFDRMGCCISDRRLTVLDAEPYRQKILNGYLPD